jgi:hypothetical protein
VDAATKSGLLELIDRAVEQDWTVRDACRLLELGEGRAWRWMARRARDELDDRPSGGNPVHGLLADEVDEIVALFHEWGEIDRSHRKLAHRGSYLERVWVSLSSVRRVLAAQDLFLKPPPRPGRSVRKPFPEWVEYAPNRLWIYDTTCRHPAVPPPGCGRRRAECAHGHRRPGLHRQRSGPRGAWRRRRGRLAAGSPAASLCSTVRLGTGPSERHRIGGFDGRQLDLCSGPLTCRPRGLTWRRTDVAQRSPACAVE